MGCVLHSFRNSQHFTTLTKIVTALVTLRLSHQHQISLTETFFTVSKRASKIGGTTANLKPGDTLTILDLLYGLLLPRRRYVFPSVSFEYREEWKLWCMGARY